MGKRASTNNMIFHRLEDRWARRVRWAAPVLLVCSLSAAPTVRTASGVVAGKTSADSKVRIFEGIPYAAPPVGELRWKPAQPAAPWSGTLQATHFGPRCMQGHAFSDMVFRDNGPSENCLSLNVWAPADDAVAKLPVMVWIYGGGFVAGGTSEPRQDGERLAHKGVVVVSLNYRLGIFGFFAHPDLAKESDNHAAGNYGLLDQAAALEWVQKNIAAFGGDPANVTIFGESAGSFSVSALMASPLSKGLLHRAIGESGAFFSDTLPAKSLEESEKADAEFSRSIGKPSIADLRALSADELLKLSTKKGARWFSPNVDCYFLPRSVASIYAAGEQSHVPLLAGWNADEGSYQTILGKETPTPEHYREKIRARFGEKAEELLKLYPGSTEAEVKRSAQDLAGDQFTGFSTWKWLEMQSKTGAAPVYRYRFEDAPPSAASSGESAGAYHSAEIEFVFQALASKKLPWRPQDTKLSDEIATYWTNFAKTGNPNGNGLPEWPEYKKEDGYQVLHLNATIQAAPDQQRARYEFLDSSAASNR